MSTPTPADIQQDWLDHLRHQGKSPHTIKAYRRGLQHFARWYAGTYDAPLTPPDVMPRDVRDWQAKD